MPVDQPAVAAHAEVPEPTLAHLTSEGWVYVGLTIFLVLAFTVGRAWQRIRDGLDARIASTRRSLDEAATLRSEAEALLAAAHEKQKQAERDVADILAHAQAEATALRSKAETDLRQLIERRSRIAEEKIAAEERQAIAEVRAQAADAAVAAAARLIGDRNDAAADRALVDSAIGSLGRS